MLKIYGSMLCKDCVQCKTAFDAQGIPYEFTDINASMANLKEFLAIRDTHAEYDEVRAAKGVGIPTLVKEDGTITLDFDAWLIEHGYEKSVPVQEGQTCSLDGRGC